MRRPARPELEVVRDAPCLATRRTVLVTAGVTVLTACSAAVGADPDATASSDAPAADVPAADRSLSDAPAAGDTIAVCRGRDVGPVDSFPVGTLTAVGATGLFVGRDARGLWALELICPHFGGDVALQSDGQLHCLELPESPGGNDVFDTDGRYLRGPTAPPGRSPNLVNRAVTVCDGHVFVDRTLEVPLGTRTAAS